MTLLYIRIKIICFIWYCFQSIKYHNRLFWISKTDSIGIYNNSKDHTITVSTRAPIDKLKTKENDKDYVITTPPKPVFCIYDSDDDNMPKTTRKLFLNWLTTFIDSNFDNMLIVL